MHLRGHRLGWIGNSGAFALCRPLWLLKCLLLHELKISDFWSQSVGICTRKRPWSQKIPVPAHRHSPVIEWRRVMHTPPHINVSSLRYRGVRLDRVRFTPLGKFVCGLGQSGGIIFGFVLLWGNEEFRCQCQWETWSFKLVRLFGGQLVCLLSTLGSSNCMCHLRNGQLVRFKTPSFQGWFEYLAEALYYIRKYFPNAICRDIL